jgi:hypothetical protein
LYLYLIKQGEFDLSPHSFTYSLALDAVIKGRGWRDTKALKQSITSV